MEIMVLGRVKNERIFPLEVERLRKNEILLLGFSARNYFISLRIFMRSIFIRFFFLRYLLT